MATVDSGEGTIVAAHAWRSHFRNRDEQRRRAEDANNDNSRGGKEDL